MHALVTVTVALLLLTTAPASALLLSWQFDSVFDPGSGGDYGRFAGEILFDETGTPIRWTITTGDGVVIKPGNPGRFPGFTYTEANTGFYRFAAQANWTYGDFVGSNHQIAALIVNADSDLGLWQAGNRVHWSIGSEYYWDSITSVYSREFTDLPYTPLAAAAPEPGTLLSLATGLPLLGYLFRRKGAHNSTTRGTRCRSIQT